MAGMENKIEEAWVKYSDMDSSKYTGLVSAFSMVTSFFMNPFGVVTTRQQACPSITGENTSKLSTFEALRHTTKSLGPKALFRGWIVTAGSGLPSQVLYLNATESSREYFQNLFKRLRPETASVIVDGTQATLSSIIANFVSGVIIVPSEVISTRLIIQGKTDIGTIAMTKLIYQESGLKGFMRGFGTSFWSSVFFSAQWWFTYSILRREGSKIEFIAKDPITLDAVTGCISGVVSTIVLHPLDTIRTRIMTGSPSPSTSTSTSTSTSFTTSTSTSFTTSTSAAISPSFTTSTSAAISPSFTTSTSAAISPSTSTPITTSSVIRSKVGVSFWHTLDDIMKKEGASVLWRGLRASTWQSALSSTGFAMIYEMIKRHSMNENSNNKEKSP